MKKNVTIPPLIFTLDRYSIGKFDFCYILVIQKLISYVYSYVQMIKRKEKGVQLGIYLHRQVRRLGA